MLAAGYYEAKAIQGALGYTEGGKEQVAVMFQITDGEASGATITWHGYFTEKTTDRTLEALMTAGWDGENLSDLNGLGSKPVQIVVEHEEYDGKTRAKVQWVNRPGGGLALKKKMDDGQKTSFAQRMRGRAASIKSKMAKNGEDASFNFGANDDSPP